MLRRTPEYTGTDTLFPDPPLFRSPRFHLKRQEIGQFRADLGLLFGRGAPKVTLGDYVRRPRIPIRDRFPVTNRPFSANRKPWRATLIRYGRAGWLRPRRATPRPTMR